MPRRYTGFTLLETLTSISIVALLFILLIPAAGRIRNADGLQVSMANLATIMKATIQYHADSAGRNPMRACGYSNGQVTGGWDTWSVGGKNCSAAFPGVSYANSIFDEPAHSRFLNAYLYQARIPQPAGYINTGSGPTWRFIHGFPTAAQRLSLEIPVFKSPGDIATHQGNQWPNPNPSLSGYDHVGTSYVTNMKWWDSVLPGGVFSAVYEAGMSRINQAFNGANPNYVFMHDAKADLVVNSQNPGFQTQGEFGKVNASMMGFVDGRVGYLQVIPNYPILSGPGYTFLP